MKEIYIGEHKQPDKKKKRKKCLNFCGKKCRKVGWWVEKILSFFLGLMAFCTLGDIWVLTVEKMGWIFKLLGIFSQCWREKNLLPMYSHGGGGGAIHIQGIPKRAEKMVWNLQINQKHSPQNWKGVIKRQTAQIQWRHFYTGAQQHETKMLSIVTSQETDYQESRSIDTLNVITLKIINP